MKQSATIIVIAVFCFLLVGSATHTASVPEKPASVSTQDTIKHSMDKLEFAINELERRL